MEYTTNGLQPKRSWSQQIISSIEEECRKITTDVACRRIDGVIVCSPTAQHEDQVKAALHAGKAVFSEKPITAEVHTTRSCYELAESVGKPLLCAFHRRFDPSFMTVKSRLTARAAGQLRMVRSSSHDVQPPPVTYIKNSDSDNYGCNQIKKIDPDITKHLRDIGDISPNVNRGIIKDSTVHDLDMALWLSESPARTVFALGNAFDPAVRACEDLDLVLVLIEHASGSMSIIDNGRRCAHGYDQRLEAICDEGSFVVTNRHTDLCYQHTAIGSSMPAIDRSFVTRYPQAYLNELEHFLDVIAEGCQLRVSKSDVLSVMRLAEAATESARSGRPVDLNQF